MRIGIITIHNSPNYGACLQAYALWKYLEDQEHDVEIIDLYRPYQKEYIKSSRFKAYKKPLTFRALISAIFKRLGFKKKANITYSQKAFDRFNSFNSVIHMSQPYKKIDDLYTNPPSYDLYISGSDQLWNPTQPYCIEPYFLTFVPKGKTKISFATSIGVTNIPKNIKRDFKKWLKSYVREQQGKELLESFIDRKIYQVSDPTFLLQQSEWYSKAKIPNTEKPYILLFALQHNQSFYEFATRMSKESNKKLVYLCQVAEQIHLKDASVINDAGIEDFLGYIAKADMVLTESFHGTVFSLLLGTKNFYTYISPQNKRGSRIEDLLQPFELSSHILYNLKDVSFNSLNGNNINTEKNTQVIDALRNNAERFLKLYI